jgi:hypothetical protein
MPIGLRRELNERWVYAAGGGVEIKLGLNFNVSELNGLFHAVFSLGCRRLDGLCAALQKQDAAGSTGAKFLRIYAAVITTSPTSPAHLPPGLQSSFFGLRLGGPSDTVA